MQKEKVDSTKLEIITMTGSKLWHYGYKYVKSKRNTALENISQFLKKEKKPVQLQPLKKIILNNTKYI